MKRFLPFSAIFLFQITITIAQQGTYFGVWRPGAGVQQTRVETSLSAWSAQDNDFVNNQGLRLVDFEKYTENGQDYYFGVWRPGTGVQQTRVETSLSAWSAQNNDFVNNQGLRLVDFEKYEANGQDYYFGVWRPETGVQQTRVETSLSAWSAQDNDFVNNQGLRLVDFDE